MEMARRLPLVGVRVIGWLGGPWWRALGGSTRQFQPQEPSGDAAPSVGLASWPLTPKSTIEARGAAFPPPARRLRPLGC